MDLLEVPVREFLRKIMRSEFMINLKRVLMMPPT